MAPMALFSLSRSVASVSPKVGRVPSPPQADEKRDTSRKALRVSDIRDEGDCHRYRSSAIFVVWLEPATVMRQR